MNFIGSNQFIIINNCYCHSYYHYRVSFIFTNRPIFFQFREKNKKALCLLPNVVWYSNVGATSDYFETSENINLFIFYQSCNNFIYQPARKPCSKWNPLLHLRALFAFSEVYTIWYRNEAATIILYLSLTHHRGRRFIYKNVRIIKNSLHN